MNRLHLLFLSCLVSCGAVTCVLAQAPAVAELKPRPLYTQCATLPEGTAEVVTKALNALKDKDAQMRQAAAQQLGAHCDGRALEPLLGALKDAELPVRMAAIEALGKLGSPDAVEPLIDLINDKDWRVRWALVAALGSYTSFRARNMLVNGIANPSDVDVSDPDDMRVRCVAILTANQLTNSSYSRKTVVFLFGFTRSRHAPIRALAEQTLYELKNTRNGASELIGILKTEHSLALRVWAIEWLGKLRIEKARRALTEAATEDPEDVVQRAAAEALKMLGAAQ